MYRATTGSTSGAPMLGLDSSFNQRASSLGLWIGRSEAQYSSEDLLVELKGLGSASAGRKGRGESGSSKNNMAERQLLRRRQDLVRDSKLLELLSHFNNIVYFLVCTDNSSLAREKLNLLSASERAALEKKYRVPQLIKECCISTYDFVRLAVQGNSKSAARLLSISGLFLSLINHEVSKLSPPIETILVASPFPKLLSPHDVQHLIKQMCELYALEDDAADVSEKKPQPYEMIFSAIEIVLFTRPPFVVLNIKRKYSLIMKVIYFVHA